MSLYECVDKLNPKSPRFVLGEVSKKTKNPLICFGINPSTAVPEKLDRTLSRVKNESMRRGFDGWIMLNLYPQRATNPKNIIKEIDDKIHKINILKIKDVLYGYSNSVVWVAWGGSITKRVFLKDCLREIVAVMPKSIKLVHMGDRVGKKKHPHHPLFLKKDLLFNPFDIDDYLKNL